MSSQVFPERLVRPAFNFMLFVSSRLVKTTVITTFSFRWKIYPAEAEGYLNFF